MTKAARFKKSVDSVNMQNFIYITSYEGRWRGRGLRWALGLPVGARQAVGFARAAPEMNHDTIPAARMYFPHQ